MADNQQVKTKKELALERLKGKYPEKTFEDEEELFGQINDDYDEYDGKVKEYQEHEQGLFDMMSADPRSAKFLSDWKKGEDPAIGLVRAFGMEIKDAIDDPEKLEAIAAANKEYVERVAKSKELEEEYQENLEKSLLNLDEYQKANGLTDAQVDEAMEFLGKIISDGIVGIFTPETIDMAMKAIHHDSDVANAAEEAEIRGRNAKIEEKLRKNTSGDGTAQLDGQNNVPHDKPKRDIGALDRFGSGTKDIWERGGEKRTKY